MTVTSLTMLHRTGTLLLSSLTDGELVDSIFVLSLFDLYQTQRRDYRDVGYLYIPSIRDYEEILVMSDSV